MRLHLKPLDEQVVVITGATSGIGLATARLAASQGARVFLISRNAEELERICGELRGGLRGELRSDGAEVDFYAADVGNEEEVRNAAQRCIDRFGGFDTWVNNAGVSIYGRILETPTEDGRRLFDTNFWGLHFGCKAAVDHLRDAGGALINIGSVLSDVSIPIQGLYSATKHAVKGYTDALRRELDAEKAPIAVTLVKPAAIDTPYPEHARGRMGAQAVHVPPVYAPEVVARVILRCATQPIREIGVGASARLYPILDRWAPRMQDLYMSRAMMEEGQSLKDVPHRRGQEGFYRSPSRQGRMRGNYPGHVMESSLSTEIALRPLLSSLAVAGVAVAALGAYAWLRRGDSKFEATAGKANRVSSAA